MTLPGTSPDNPVTREEVPIAMVRAWYEHSRRQLTGDKKRRIVLQMDERSLELLLEGVALLLEPKS